MTRASRKGVGPRNIKMGLVEEIKNLAIDELTPIEAISKLYELQQKAKRG